MIFMKFVLHQFQRPRLALVPAVPITLHTEREPLFGRDFAVKFFGLFQLQITEKHELNSQTVASVLKLTCIRKGRTTGLKKSEAAWVRAVGGLFLRGNSEQVLILTACRYDLPAHFETIGSAATEEELFLPTLQTPSPIPTASASRSRPMRKMRNGIRYRLSCNFVRAVLIATPRSSRLSSFSSRLDTCKGEAL